VDNALVVDLGNLNTISVDQTSWVATIGPGANLGQVTDGLSDQGNRVIAHGPSPQVGLGGHAGIGGQGPLSRLYGLTLDQVQEVEVVLANGTITTANANTNSDLFWALRGAAASFGIVTQFKFVTHPAPTTITNYAFQYIIGGPEDLANTFMKWQAFISQPSIANDRNFDSVITLTPSSALIQGSRLGTPDELQASGITAALGDGATINITSLDWAASVLNWVTYELENLAGNIPSFMYMKNVVITQSEPMTSATAQAWFNYMQANNPSDVTTFITADLEGGAISDVANNATAYAHRDALYTIAAYTLAGFTSYPQDGIDFLNGMMETIIGSPTAPFGMYPGYVDPLVPASQWPTAYWGDNYPRLKQLKAKYDPNNVFQNPQSVGNDS